MSVVVPNALAPTPYLSKENKGIVPAQFFHNFDADVETKDNGTPCNSLFEPLVS